MRPLRHLTHTLLLAAALPAAATAYAADPKPKEPVSIGRELGDGRLNPRRGHYHEEVDGERVLHIVLRDVTVFPPLKFKNKKEEEYYWRTVRDVRKALPYAKLICETLLETYELIETYPTQAEREAHLKDMESAIFEQYKPALKKFTRSQARILVKLIKRETDQSSYNIIKAFLGSFRAGFWQTFGRVFGVNLKEEYRPDKNRQDAIVERIAVDIELGVL